MNKGGRQYPVPRRAGRKAVRRLLGSKVPDADIREDAYALSITLLGGFQVAVGSRKIGETEWGLRKVRSLLKLLALAPSHRLHREQIMDILWPDLQPEAAANNFHKSLHVARHVLEPDLAPRCPSSFVHLQGDFVLLRPPGPLWIDAEAFRNAANSAQTTSDPQAYEDALAIYQGDLLPADRYQDWAAWHREELKITQYSLLLRLSRLHEKRGEIDRGVEVLRRIISSDPAHEEAHIGIMHLLVRSGQRHLALRQYDQLSAALRRELDVEPSAGLQALHRQILSGLVPSQPHVAFANGSLPRPLVRRRALPPLVGRERELELLNTVLDALFDGRGQIVLISGEVGMGKSRLAAETTRKAQLMGALTLWGRAERRIPFNLFSSAVEGLATRMAADEFVTLLGDCGPDLASMSPTIARILGLPQPISAPGEESLDVFASTKRLLLRLAASSPVMIVLDNIHLADDRSLELLLDIIDVTRTAPVLFLVTVGTDGIPRQSLLHATSRLCDDSSSYCLELNGLSLHETRRLLTGMLGVSIDRSVLEAIHALSGGNPYYAEESVRAFRGRDQIFQLDGIWHFGNRGADQWNRAQLRQPTSVSPSVK
jgi:DNA-binding SARP family transcriptional activator